MDSLKQNGISIVFVFAELQSKISKYLPRDQCALIAQAFLLAADAHETQSRSSGEPYITHPVAVACILADMHLDAESIMAALLHDVVEDTRISIEEIAEKFGSKVAELVEGVTKLTKIRFETKAEAQAENFRKMMLAMVEDIRVILIKLADRYHNMQTLEGLRPDKRRRIALETLEIYAPIANRLGMNNFKSCFEDLGFKALYPMRYRVLEECVRKARGNRRRLVEKIQESITRRLAEEGVAVSEVVGREKRLYSIFKKMRHKGLPFSEIMDVYAFRIIAKDIRSCYVLLGAVHGLYTPIPGRFKDYIAIPKANGYQSLHTTLFGPYGVPIEIQIRTQEMDEMAQKGIAAHWLYKSASAITPTELKTREWLKQLLEMQHKAGNSLEFIENVKIDLFPEEVYVFTPNGDIMSLARGSTPVDFAYSVHTEVGNRCVAAKVNRRLAPLSQQLMSGQTVEIITSPTATPHPTWLNFVVTAKAKAAIRHFFKEQQSAETISLGKKLLQYSLAEQKLDWDSIPVADRKMLLLALSLDSEKRLFEVIGSGDRSSAVVAHQLAEILHKREYAHQQMSSLPIVGAEGVNMRFATCCYPIPGDPVRGILAKGKGIEVHTAQCAVLAEMGHNLNPEAFINITWSEEVSAHFPVKLTMSMSNYRGAIANISSTLANSQANILDFHTTELHESYFLIATIIEVTGRVHLAKVIRRLRGVRGVMRVSRQRQDEVQTTNEGN
jgi:RelA/SpoT family (p)ppGpp synthetase